MFRAQRFKFTLFSFSFCWWKSALPWTNFFKLIFKLKMPKWVQNPSFQFCFCFRCNHIVKSHWLCGITVNFKKAMFPVLFVIVFELYIYFTFYFLYFMVFWSCFSFFKNLHTCLYKCLPNMNLLHSSDELVHKKKCVIIKPCHLRVPHAFNLISPAINTGIIVLL